MNTEHIFNIAISVDEDSIRERAEIFCAEQITGALNDNWIRKGYYGKKEIGSKLEEAIENAVVKFINNNKEEFLELVAEKTAEKVMKTKAYKEKILKEAV